MRATDHKPSPRRRRGDSYEPATKPRKRTRSHKPYLSSDMPLAVWQCAQTTAQWQRHGRYLPESNRHPAKMLPELARKAVCAYSEPGEIVLDPMCGIGTTLVEASQLDRRAVGIELEPRWAKLARANLKHAKVNRAGRVIVADARRAPNLMQKATGEPFADLVLTSPPYACAVVDAAAESTAGRGPLRRADTENYSQDRSNLGYARGENYLLAMSEVYAACAAALKPGGYLVLVTKDMRQAGGLHDLSGDTIRLCQACGLVYWQRVIGLLATVRDSEIIMRPSLWQTLQVRRARARGDRTCVVAHEDVLVFRKPAAASNRRPA